jgi:hypothetical protein
MSIMSPETADVEVMAKSVDPATAACPQVRDRPAPTWARRRSMSPAPLGQGW